jgi:diguanylate cyclase (GGDEF)-like protein
MTQLACYSRTPGNVTVFETSEKTMSENCVLTLPPTPNNFFEMLDYEFKRAIRYKNAVTLMFIKLCHLDEVLGNYGQSTAEHIMSEIERIISLNIRDTDRQFMYGKDEFMIILPNTPKKCASSIIPKLQRLIEDYRYSNGRGANLNLTPRFGLASYPNHEDSTINQADKIDIAKTKSGIAVIKPIRRNTAT